MESQIPNLSSSQLLRHMESVCVCMYVRACVPTFRYWDDSRATYLSMFPAVDVWRCFVGS